MQGHSTRQLLCLGRVAFATTGRQSRARLQGRLQRAAHEALAEAGHRLPRGSVVIEASDPEPHEGLGGLEDGVGWAFSVYVGVPPSAVSFWEVVGATALGALMAYGAQRLLEEVMRKAFDIPTVKPGTSIVTSARHQKAKPRRRATRKTARGRAGVRRRRAS